VVRGTFSPARAWRPAVGSRLTQTLGSVGVTVRSASKVSACRRELNSHDAAEPRNLAFPSARQVTDKAADKPRLNEHQGKAQGRDAANIDDQAPTQQIKRLHRVEADAIHSVHWADAFGGAGFGHDQLLRRLERAALRWRQHAVGGVQGRPPGATKLRRVKDRRSYSAALPNPSVELRANGMPPGPRYSAGVHFL
jgi:hypothetical protein